jgi:hypothetical protein
LQGFDSPVRTLTLEVNQYLRLDLVMQVGPVKQAVEVVGSAELLRTADASLGEVIEPTLTKELPFNGGHALNLALLAPAAHAGFGAQMGNANPLYWRPNQDSALSVGGGRPRMQGTTGIRAERYNSDDNTWGRASRFWSCMRRGKEVKCYGFSFLYSFCLPLLELLSFRACCFPRS